MVTEGESLRCIDELWLVQHEREAMEREKLRRAVAETSVPLPSTLLARLLHLFQLQALEILQSHAGFDFATRRNSYEASIAVLDLSLWDLLSAISRFEQEVLNENPKVLTVPYEGTLEAFERRIQKELLATTSAIVSVVDHSRWLRGLMSISDYDNRVRSCFGTDGLHEFVVGLGVLLHHFKMLGAEGHIRREAITGIHRARVALDNLVVQFAIDRYSAGFGEAQRAQILNFLSSAPRFIDLRTVFEDYRKRTRDFHSWFTEQIAFGDYPELRDYDRCLREIRNNPSQTMWSAMATNWLRATSPDPHKRAAAGFDDSRLSDSGLHLELHRTEIADRRVSTLDVVKAFDVIEHI